MGSAMIRAGADRLYVGDAVRTSPARRDHHREVEDPVQARPGPLRDVFLGAIINMGFWDPMSCHFYKREFPPLGISPWTNLRLGWADTKQVRVVKPTERAALLLGLLEDGSRGPGDQDPAVGDHLLPGREPAACRVRSASARPRRPHHARGRHHCRVPARAGPGQARERRSDDPPSRGRRRVEATRLLGVLKHAQSMLRLVDPKATQSFLGKLIKRAGRAVGTIRK